MSQLELKAFLEGEILVAQAVDSKSKMAPIADGKLAVLQPLLNIVDDQTKPKNAHDLGVADAINDVLQHLGLVKPRAVFWK